MAKRCKHLRCVVSEETVTYLQWDVKDGIKVDEGASSNSSPTGQVEVECYECGAQMAFGKRKPKWLKKILDQ